MPLEAADLAAEKGIRVYTVLAARYASNPLGMLIPATQIDTTELEAIASKTGGRFFRARDRAGLEATYAEIERLERTPRTEKRWAEQFDLYAAAADPGLRAVRAGVALDLDLGEEVAVNGAEFLGFDLLRPGLTSFLVAAPLALLLGWLALGARERARAKLVDARHLERFLPGYSRSRARLRVFCVTGGFLFLALALVGPVRGYTLREVRHRGLDLVVCLDTSRSMLVQDLKPDRLERAKREVSLLLDHLKGDRVALVAFSGDVRNVAPLTHDRDTLRWFLNSLSPRENVVGGTDIGGALEHALGLFDGRSGSHEAIVLLTDGEDLEGHGLAMAEEAKTRGIGIYVVGMATESGGKIPDTQGWVKDELGHEVVSRLDGETLAKIADVTGGAYLSAESSALPLEEIHEKRLSRLEGREFGGGKEKIPHDRYQWPLVLGVACLLVAAGLSERRPAARARPAAVPATAEERAA